MWKCLDAQRQSNLKTCLERMTSGPVLEYNVDTDRNVLIHAVEVFIPNRKRWSKITLSRRLISNFKQLATYLQHERAEFRAVLDYLDGNIQNRCRCIVNHLNRLLSIAPSKKFQVTASSTSKKMENPKKRNGYQFMIAMIERQFETKRLFLFWCKHLSFFQLIEVSDKILSLPNR